MVIFNPQLEDKGVFIFPKGISSKVNISVQLFILDYYNVTVQQVNHSSMRMSLNVWFAAVNTGVSLKIYIFFVHASFSEYTLYTNQWNGTMYNVSVHQQLQYFQP